MKFEVKLNTLQVIKKDITVTVEANDVRQAEIIAREDIEESIGCIDDLENVVVDNLESSIYTSFLFAMGFPDNKES